MNFKYLKEKHCESLNELDNLFIQKHVYLQNISTEQRDYIHRQALISTIGASTRIENALLTDEEVEWLDTVLTLDGKPTAFLNNKNLIENKLSKDRERSIEEVAGCRSLLLLVFTQHQDFYPLTETHIRGLHHQLMQFYPKAKTYLGRYKTLPNSVVETNHATGKVREVFKTAEAGPITEAAMTDLVSWYNRTIKMTPFTIAVICEFVYRFLAIHPFQDGNGRLGRALFLLGLLHSPNEAIRSMAPFIAIDRKIEATRSEYYFVLNRCSNGQFKRQSSDYHIEYLVEYMIKTIKSALEGIGYSLNRYRNLRLLSPAARKVLDCFKEHPEVKLTTAMLCDDTQLPRRTVINALNKLLKFELIQKYGQGRGVYYQLTF